MQKIKLFYIVLGVIAISMIIILIVILFRLPKQGQENNKGFTSTLPYSLNNGKTIQLKDFTKSAVAIDPGVVTLYKNPTEGVIFYNTTGRLFSLVLNEYDPDEFNKKRPELEKKFISILDISQTDACLLNVQVSNIGAVDGSDLNGKIFPLSFCK